MKEEAKKGYKVKIKDGKITKKLNSHEDIEERERKKANNKTK